MGNKVVKNHDPLALRLLKIMCTPLPLKTRDLYFLDILTPSDDSASKNVMRSIDNKKQVGHIFLLPPVNMTSDTIRWTPISILHTIVWGVGQGWSIWGDGVVPHIKACPSHAKIFYSPHEHFCSPPGQNF